jgi:UDP-N-acetylmuramate dehydrogenase
MNAGAYDGEMKNVVYSVSHLTPDGGIGRCERDDLKMGYRTSVYRSNRCIITGVTIKLKKADPEDIRAKMDDFMERRSSKQPLDYPSAGSVFKNNHAFGAPSGKLIDECGLKGLSIGGAQIAPFHGNFIINTGNATAADIKALVQAAQKAVHDKFGFNLEPEIIFV